MAIPNPIFPSCPTWNNEETIEAPPSYTSLPDQNDQDLTVAPAHYTRWQPSKVIFLFLSGLMAIGLMVSLFKVDNIDGSSKMLFSFNGPSWGGSREAETAAEEKIIRPVTEPRGVAEGVSGKSNPGLGATTPSFSWTNRMLDWQRTSFHFQPKENWMNDPNGPVYYNGYYHFFYQYNPKGAIWGNIIWGHAVSKDLINWRHLPFAMVADQWYDYNGVWTGSATILQNGQLVMLYTGSTNESVQVQNLAYPVNPNDHFLVEWEKYSENPVLVPPHGIHIKDFRDPTTAWYTTEGKWRFVIGSKVNTTGIILVYETVDFKSYELLDKMFHGVQGTGMWECVDFYPVSTIEEIGLDTSDNGPAVKHIMKTSLDDDRNDYYALGTYDETVCTWTPDDPKIDVGIGLRYDYGNFYASKTFYDQDKKRRILWGWITEKDSEASDVKKGWASLQAIPRTILFDKKTGNNLLHWPVEEVEQLRSRGKSFNKIVIDPGSIVPLDINSANQLDITAEFEINKKSLKMINGTNSEYSCGGSSGASQQGAFGPFGLLVLAYKDQSEQTPIYFYIAKGENGKFKTFFCADHSRSSEANDVIKGVYGDLVTVLEGEQLSMRVLVDHSIVESFAQGGRTCITSRIYPTKAIYEDAKLFLFNNATDATITANVKVWQMGAAKSLRPFCVLFSIFLSILLLFI